jgi:tartrate dehydratase beta subunit/fumarate hydratase class I family protein
MKTYQLALAAVVLMGSSSMALAEEWRYDPTFDHVYYYGPVKQQAGHPAAKPASHVVHSLPRGAEVPIDRTPDHIYYYGPVAH